MIAPIVTKSQLAEYLGLWRDVRGKMLPDASTISTYVKRGKICLNNQGMINTELKINKSWIEGQVAKRASKTYIEAAVKIGKDDLSDSDINHLSEMQPTAYEVKAPRKKQESDEGETSASEGRYSLEVEYKRKMIELTAQKTKNLRLQERKLNAELINYKDVCKVSEAILNQFRSRMYQSGENIILELITLGGFDAETSAKMKSKWKTETNMATSETVKSIVASLEDITSETALEDE